MIEKIIECCICNRFGTEELFMNEIYFEPIDRKIIYKIFKVENGYCPECYNSSLKELFEYKKKITKYSERL